MQMPPEDKDFFLLLRAGLWQEACEPLSETPDWEHIYLLSREQTVQGIIADGIGIYRPPLIPQEWSDHFLKATGKIIRRNHAINALMANICQQFNDQGIAYVVLKGQAVGQCYPNPDLRNPGDIDFLIDDVADYQRAFNLLAPQGTVEGTENITINDIVIELHHSLHITFGKRIERFFTHLQREMFQGKVFSAVTIGGTKIQMPDVTLNAVYLFEHILKHLIYSALGLRQMCDFALYLHCNKDTIDKSKLFRILKEAGLTREWHTCVAFCHDYLGLETEEPNGGIHNASNVIWKRMKQSGNFGRNIEFRLQEKSLRQRLTRLLFYLHWFKDGMKISPNLTFRLIQSKKLG